VNGGHTEKKETGAQNLIKVFVFAMFVGLVPAVKKKQLEWKMSLACG